MRNEGYLLSTVWTHLISADVIRRSVEKLRAKCCWVCLTLRISWLSKGEKKPKALERSLFSVQKWLQFSMNSALCIFLPPFSGVLALAINSNVLPFPSDNVADTYSVLAVSNFTSPGFGDGWSQVASDGWLKKEKDKRKKKNMHWNETVEDLHVLCPHKEILMYN